GNPELGAGSEVDHLGISTDERDELEFRQSFEQGPGKFDSLANRDDDLGIAKALDELSKIARRLTVAYDVVMANQRKAFQLIDDVLIVIWNNDFHRRSRAERSCSMRDYTNSCARWSRSSRP